MACLVPGMVHVMGDADTIDGPTITETDRHTFLTLDDLSARYGIGRTRTYELVRESWFPRCVIDSPRRWLLAAVITAEYRRSEIPPRRAHS